MNPRPAVFLDRDGTIIEAVHYLSDPQAVRLIPDVAPALLELQAAGFACILITNQSAIGRGILSLEGFYRVQAEVYRQLCEHGIQLDGCYFCPSVPTSSDRSVLDDPERKPAPGMILRACRELNLQVNRSWMIGDMLSDVLAGRNAGCRDSLFVTCGQGSHEDLTGHDAKVFPNVATAANHILKIHRAFPHPEPRPDHS